ncbi:MarR family transcriptional regulator [Gandjariella thermophila]|uniref:HTH marR-type domain-containing protein n=1 Tax=Gandjariella thermophila TaxID=1931992 RepID=A0A4D4JGY7_9PSEU|nr:MarR family transcriptional regulator [Gandjariella thermophila]GDY33898.1 hypothetical protein GTS_55310 [Gandjariella thermophila]
MSRTPAVGRDCVEAVLAALATGRGWRATALARALYFEPSTVRRALTRLETAGLVRRERCQDADRRGVPWSWRLVVPVEHAQAVLAAHRPRRRRLPAGELRARVAAHLAAHSERALTPGEIARALDGRAWAAVRDAAEALVEQGHVERVGRDPVRYRLAQGREAPRARGCLREHAGC